MPGIWQINYQDGMPTSASIHVLPCLGCATPVADTVIGDAPLCHPCAQAFTAWRREHQRLRALPTWARDWLTGRGGD